MTGAAVTIAETQLREKIGGIAAGRVLFDEPMSAHTSMGVGGRADALAFPDTVEGLNGLVSFLLQEGIPFLPVGNGTNLIVRDGGYRGVLISLEALRRLEVRGTGDAGAVRVHAQAGASCSALVDLSLRESLAGMEFCAGIPGSVGGGVRMNAGAWGKEMKDVVASISLLDPGARMREIVRKDLHFEYRNLRLPEEAIITAADFHLVRGDRDAIGKRIAEITAQRKARHPLAQRSAGSVFKNPPGHPAGKMIEEAGLKGLRIGGAEISEKHGNFIVNRGGAKAADIVALMDMVRERILDARGVLLEPELKIIGDEG
ncbi:MAG: UDP-N-acetylmuramate dehydrogenase [Deltaproteobacteria bacterium]|nr:UDP-N-acetylmuramate dehydrogenase [Deltaproteobacteria bacterium]